MRMIYSMKRKVALVVACIMCSLTASAAEGDVASVTVGGTTTSYDTFDAAITAVQSCTEADKAVVKLLADIALGDTCLSISGGVFTIDLNGFELSSTYTGVDALLGLVNSANVTITDSGADGAIRTNSTAIRARNTSIVTINGGTFHSADSEPIWFQSTGKLTVNDGVIIGGLYGICSTKGITTINGGNIHGTSNGITCSGTLTVYGGTVTSDDLAVRVASSSASVTINGGSFTGGSYAFYGWSGCSATINGGEFSGGEYDLGGVSSVKVNGATFPEGLSVKNATLNAILGSGYAYWAGDTMLAPADDATEITDKGDITVKAACTHESGTKSYTNNGDDHTYTYSCCNLTVTEDHSEVADDGDCTTAVICPNCDGTIIGAKTSHDWSGKDGICTVCNHVCDHIGHINPIYTAINNVITESCSKCKVSLGTATITATNATYDGTAQETATVAYGTGWTGDRNLTVTYANNVDAGTATASITIGGVTARTTFTIQPKEITGAAVAIEQGVSFVYSGEPFTPAVSVTLDGKPLAASDYQVSYADNVNAGQAMVTVTGRGNYSGSATATFTIAKAPAPTLPAATVSRNYAVAKVSVPTGIVAGEGSSVSVGTASGSGSDKVAAVALDAKGNLTFTLSGGADGDEIVLPVHLHYSPNYEGPITATVTVTLTDKLDQRPLTVEAGNSTVPSGGTLELSIGGGSGKGAVTYEVINGTGSASLSGSTLTGGAPGTVTVIATKAGTSQYNPARSQPLVITIE